MVTAELKFINLRSYNCGVSSLQEIEQAIDRLPREDFMRLMESLRTRHADAWDRQIEEDAASGKLQALYDSLTSKGTAAEEMPLHDFLNDKKLP